MRKYIYSVTTHYMNDAGEVCGCGTGGGPFDSLADTVLDAVKQHTEGPGNPEWDGRGPKTITIHFETEDGHFGETFRHYGAWSGLITNRALDWFNGVDSTDDWRRYDGK